jgi:Cu2+-exporting ATPase
MADTANAQSIYFEPLVAERFVQHLQGGADGAWFVVGGLRCAGCARKVEKTLAAHPGVTRVDLNYATQRARVEWDAASCALGDVVRAVEAMGYAAHPFDPERRQRAIEAERRELLQRLLVAGLLSMQIMMFAFGLYFGEAWDIEPWIANLFRWASLALAVPLMTFCAVPFLRGAARDLRARSASMDSPIALALMVGFAASAYATILAPALPVYFDSISMFCFLLLGARFLELGIRARSVRALDALDRSVPVLANRLLADGRVECVPAAMLKVGDRVLIRPGEQIPADGKVLQGSSAADESLLSGESRPVPKSVDDRVLGGSLNTGGVLTVAIEAVGEQALLGRIIQLMHRAQAERSPLRSTVDRIAGGFVIGVLAIAALTALFWLQRGSPDWLPITLSVLVVSCPCALSLATPAALTSAGVNLLNLGFLVTRTGAMERLARVTHVMFDKTGTLTAGTPAIRVQRTVSPLESKIALAIAAALERYANHPIALAFRGHDDPRYQVQDPLVDSRGVSGTIDGVRYCLGSPDCEVEAPTPTGQVAPVAQTGKRQDLPPCGTEVVLRNAAGVLSVFSIADAVRPSAARLIEALRGLGIGVSLRSGDRAGVVLEIARGLGIRDCAGEQNPAQKLAALSERRRAGAVVAMIGDGINDGPVLAGADVGIAMGSGAALAQDTADVVMLNENLESLAQAIRVARRLRAVIHQNLFWALSYNLIAIPAAALGFVPPWLAAVGMSLSSLIVVLNAGRLAR